MMTNFVIDSLVGLAIGDALGVPVEFKSREYLNNNPITDMIGYGTYNQPLGTWSDDSSLTFCLADSLCNGYDLIDIAKKMVDWYYKASWTPYEKVFDVGMLTSKEIIRLKKLLDKKDFNLLISREIEQNENTNGNGSLMRILPLVFLIKDYSIEEKYKFVKEVSALTHSHIRSCLACLIYIVYATNLLNGKDKFSAYDATKVEINAFFDKINLNKTEIAIFKRILKNNIADFSIKEINSSGYVLDTLEASLWCILNHNTFESTVLSAVNMGEDTDTTGAVTGGLAGIIYGIEKIPQKWVNSIAKIDQILNLGKKLDVFYKE